MNKIQLNSTIESAVSEALTDQALRIGAILRHPDAKGREEMAMTLALNSTLNADAAVALLRSAPKAHASGDRFLAAMAREGNIEIDSSGAQPSADPKAKRKAELSAAAKAVSAARAAI